jgi:putative addiction module component (TIGR02574 family)
MGNTFLAEILKLAPQERIQLVELIWDSIAAAPYPVEITPELKAELEAGLAEFDADPNGGFSWDEVKKAARDNSWRTV